MDINSQWGKNWIDGKNTFSIQYISFALVVAGGEYSWDGLDNMILDVSLIAFTAKKETQDYNTYWISLGY